MLFYKFQTDFWGWSQCQKSTAVHQLISALPYATNGLLLAQRDAGAVDGLLQRTDLLGSISKLTGPHWLELTDACETRLFWPAVWKEVFTSSSLKAVCVLKVWSNKHSYPHVKWSGSHPLQLCCDGKCLQRTESRCLLNASACLSAGLARVPERGADGTLQERSCPEGATSQMGMKLWKWQRPHKSWCFNASVLQSL